MLWMPRQRRGRQSTRINQLLPIEFRVNILYGFFRKWGNKGEMLLGKFEMNLIRFWNVFKLIVMSDLTSKLITCFVLSSLTVAEILTAVAIEPSNVWDAFSPYFKENTKLHLITINWLMLIKEIIPATKFSQTISCVNVMLKTKVSEISSFSIFRVDVRCNSALWPHTEKIRIRHKHPNTGDRASLQNVGFNLTSTWLMVQENFIPFTCHQIFRYCTEKN
jgi:hypothetical protein